MSLHIDTVDGESTGVSDAGIPAILAETLQDWLGVASAPDEDVAQFVGWSVEDVARHRAQGLTEPRACARLGDGAPARHDRRLLS